MSGRTERKHTSLDQDRAHYAWQQVEHAQKSLKNFDSYLNLAKAAPALIMQNGLMQTLAFYQGKQDAHHTALLEDIAEWVCERMGWPNHGNLYSNVMKGLYGNSGLEYMRATREALELLKWIRQFAAAAHKGGGK